jgi:zinc and cadmium transporter
METAVYTLMASAAVACVSLAGALVLFVSPATLRAWTPTLIALAAGVLLGDAFLHLLPEAVETAGSGGYATGLTLAGIVSFFLAEKIMRWRRHASHSAASVQPMARMNLLGDALHNFSDGVVLAAAFSLSPPAGVATTLAILAHELPQEIGDVGALIHGGYAPRAAVLRNFLCALSCPLGALFAIVFESSGGVELAWLTPIAAGGFIYIAAASILPALQQDHTSLLGAAVQVGVLLLGVSAMLLISGLESWLGLS